MLLTGEECDLWPLQPTQMCLGCQQDSSAEPWILAMLLEEAVNSQIQTKLLLLAMQVGKKI